MTGGRCLTADVVCEEDRFGAFRAECRYSATVFLASVAEAELAPSSTPALVR